MGSYPLGDMPHICPDGQLPSLGVLSVAAVTHSLNLNEIAFEIDQQLDAFEAHFGQPPDFLDGHQHVQQLPGIRDLVVKCYQRRDFASKSPV